MERLRSYTRENTEAVEKDDQNSIGPTLLRLSWTAPSVGTPSVIQHREGAEFLVWWNEQWQFRVELCPLLGSRGEIDSHIIFSLAIPVGNPSLGRLPTSSIRSAIFGSPRRRPSNFKRPDDIVGNTRFTKAPPQQRDGMTHGTHARPA